MTRVFLLFILIGCSNDHKKQKLNSYQIKELYRKTSFKKESSANHSFDLELENLRKKIDQIDGELLKNLSLRLEIVRQIGLVKKEMKLTSFQKERFEKLMKDRIKKAQQLGISDEFIRKLFTLIHNESLRSQTLILDSS